MGVHLTPPGSLRVKAELSLQFLLAEVVGFQIFGNMIRFQISGKIIGVWFFGKVVGFQIP